MIFAEICAICGGMAAKLQKITDRDVRAAVEFIGLGGSLTAWRKRMRISTAQWKQIREQQPEAVARIYQAIRRRAALWDRGDLPDEYKDAARYILAKHMHYKIMALLPVDSVIKDAPDGSSINPDGTRDIDAPLPLDAFDASTWGKDKDDSPKKRKPGVPDDVIDIRWTTGCRVHPRFVEAALAYVNGGWEMQGDSFPSWAGLLVACGLSQAVVDRWCKDNQELAVIIDDIRSHLDTMVEYHVVNGATSKDFSSDFSRFYLSNKLKDYRDVKHIEAKTESKSVSVVGVVDADLHDLLDATINLQGEAIDIQTGKEDNSLDSLVGKTVQGGAEGAVLPDSIPDDTGLVDDLSVRAVEGDKGLSDERTTPPIPFGTAFDIPSKNPSKHQATNLEISTHPATNSDFSPPSPSPPTPFSEDETSENFSEKNFEKLESEFKEVFDVG